MSHGSALPVRHLADVWLADLVTGMSCPLCGARRRAGIRYLDGWLRESVNDVSLRGELDRARGLCGPHTGAILDAERRESGSRLASAILLGAVLRIRRAELAALREAKGRGRGRALSAAARPPACMVCRAEDEGERTALVSLGGYLRDPAWAAALGAADFCLDHLLRLADTAGGEPAWPGIEARQAERIERIAAGLHGFGMNAAFDRRHLLTDEETASIPEAARLLGAPPEGRAG